MTEFISRLNKMTVPDLWYELNNKPHTIVDQYIINEIIKKKHTEQLICQAQRKKGCQFNRGCLGGKAENLPCNIIKNNNNNKCLDDCTRPDSANIHASYDETFNASDFNQQTPQQQNEPNNEDNNESTTNNHLNNRFMEDIKTVNDIHKKKNGKPIIQSPYI